MLENSSALQQSQIYTDISGLSKLKSAAKSGSPDAIEAVAEQFEALFLNLMLKSMRDANAVFAEGNYLNSSSVETYQQMLDQQLSVSMSEGSGIGLKQLLMTQLGNRQHTPQKPNNAEGSLAIAFKNPVSNNITKKDTLAQPMPSLDSSSRADKHVDRHLDLSEGPRAKNAANLNKPIVVSDINKNPQAFVNALLPAAEQAGDELGVDPLMLVAQAALETGWGKHLINHANGRSSFNLFNIKAGSSWEGKTVNKDVVEFRGGIRMQQQSQFRAYDSFEDSFKDYVSFIKENSRYSQALEQSHSPESYMRELHKAGYATDPDYSKKVTGVFQRMDAIEGT